MIQKIIMYEQFQQNGEPPCDHFDPHVMYSERPFSIQPGETVLIIINGSGHRFMDDLIFPLKFRHDNNTFFPLPTSNEQLCFMVKNCSPFFAIYAGFKSPLKWLLDMPRLVVKMCHGLPDELNQYKLKYNWSEELNNQEIVADDETLFIR